MHYNWPSAMAAKRSPLNIGRSLERNKRKQARTAENRAYRASLHQQKCNGRGNEHVIQGQIDQISLRGGGK